jgi:hypothetical protein
MSVTHGRHTELWLNGADVSRYLRSADYKVDVATATSTAFKATWQAHVVGQVGSVIDCEGLYDPTQTNIESLLATDAASVISYGPGGLESVGARARLASVKETAYAESSKVGDVVLFNWAVLTDGQVGLGYCYHTMSAETATGTGSYVDGLGATTSGAIAHLHVTGLSGTAGPNITVKFQDCTTSGGVYADIASGAFANVTTASALRLVIPGTIRQFVKVAFTIGGTNPSITFGVALART